MDLDLSKIIELNIPFEGLIIHENSIIKKANESFCSLLGYSEKEILENDLLEKLIIPSDKQYFEEYLRSTHNKPCTINLFKKNGTTLPVELRGKCITNNEIFPSPGDTKIQLNSNPRTYVTFLKELSKPNTIYLWREFTGKLFEIINSRADFRELMISLLNLLYEISECESIGIRLRDGDDFPYFETRGFPDSFIKKEQFLCTFDKNGNYLLDDSGKPILECMCGNIICGRFDPSLPFFTKYGSFITNSTTKLLATTKEEDRQSHTRNMCNAFGYESVFLTPLRAGGETFGLLQFNNRKENFFTSDFVEQIERFAGDIAIAFSQRKAEEALKRSEHDLNESQRIAHLGSWHLNLETNEVFWTKELYKMYGYDPSLPPPPYTEHKKLFTPDSWEKLSTSLENTVKTGTPYELELETIKDDGSNGWMWVRGEAVQDDKGKTIELWGAAQDITDKKITEERVRQKDREFRKLSANVPDLIYQFTRRPDGSYFVPIASEGIKNIFGCKPEDVVDNFDAIARVLHPDDVERVIRDIEYSAEHLTYFTCEFRVILPEKGVQWIYSNSSPEKLPDGSITWYGFNTNITEKKRAADSIQIASKLESIGTLAGGIAHDFNNILSSIYGNIELALFRLDDHKVKEYLEKTIDSIDRAKHLTAQLLTFAKGGTPIKKVQNIINFLKDTTEFALSGSSVTCNFEIPENLLPCNIDKNQIGQALDNIVINAMQAMPNGGAIDITARNVVIKEKEHPKLPIGNYVKISIKDHGIGIPKEYLPRIFDLFYTTKTTGHGIGLSTTYSIISRHGGSIDVESENGKGTTFHIYLPAMNTPVTDHQANLSEQHFNSGTFVVMDDEQTIRDTVGEMLSNFGYDVVKIKSGNEVVQFFKEEFDAGRKIAGMIFDLTIPGAMGGKEAIMEIRNICKNTPVFVSSGYADDPVMSQPEESGFTASLVKPFKTSELIQLLNIYIK